VRDVSLHIDSGERVGIVGPSGAGKTTMLRLLVGAVRPTSGRVLVGNRDLHDLPTRELRRTRSQIGFVHQDHRLIPNQRVLTNVLAGRLGQWSLLRSLREVYWPRRAEIERVHELLKSTGIPEKLYQRVDTLSGGQQQRVAVTRALYQEPISLLADEPVSSVDPARARDTVGMLVSIAEQRALTLCVSLHDLALAREFFPRLIGMRDGRIVFDCLTPELSNDDFADLYRLSTAEMMQDA
jgi:phosphonate transport system ATP-binding protein